MKLLVAVDGSPHSTDAARTAGYLAAAAGAEVLVFHLASDTATGHGPAAPEETPEHARVCTDDAVAVVRQAGASKVTSRIGRGLSDQVAPAILDVARSEGADIVVVGPRGLGRLGELLVGSVTQWLLHHADRPVLVVR